MTACSKCESTQADLESNLKEKEINFDQSIELPLNWDVNENTLNLSKELLLACRRRIKQQRTFDAKSLGVAVCYGCGHILWNHVDAIHTYLVNRPVNMLNDDAPATAYLRAVRNCSLTFVHHNECKDKWYSCHYCKTASIPHCQHVGNVFYNNQTKPVKEWNMTIPLQMSSLNNTYEKVQVSLCGLFN